MAHPGGQPRHGLIVGHQLGWFQALVVVLITPADVWQQPAELSEAEVDPERLVDLVHAGLRNDPNP